ncbi:hypothetical protein CS268_RS23400 [Vibrio parahaemolyticus]|nr:hypothetical protein [Vibrio parahaemolyticus]EJG1399048.1 hypothetical protein [Vibrio parahaemolyticus]
MDSLPDTQVISMNQLPKLQRRVVKQVNREAASLLAVEALARQITDLSHGQMSPEKIDQIQQYAEAIMYNLEDARERMGRIALIVNDVTIED